MDLIKGPKQVIWGRYGLLKYFQLPYVNDNEYPPVRKSFSMLAYFHDHLIDQYDWFIRMDDDAVLQWDNLNEFLKRGSLDSLRTVLGPKIPVHIEK